MSESLTVGDLVFEVRRSARRQTVSITVERDGQLIIIAPVACPSDHIERIAREKHLWIYTKLAEKELLFRQPRPKEFVNGEGFWHLGRSYRLLLVMPDDQEAAPVVLRLHEGRFKLWRDEAERGEQHFIRWYTDQGMPWIGRRVELFADRIGVTPGPVRIQDLGYRWGSCGQGGRLNFHWRTILLPPRIVEYIVVHELVHLLEPHHGSEYWRRLDRAMPDYEARRQWLAENGAEYT